MLRAVPLKLQEVLVLEYDLEIDSRGNSYKILSQNELNAIGIDTEFIEETVYCPNKAGTLYGIHFQNYPMAQTKLLYCTKGRGLDFAVDLRRDSETFKQWVCVELNAENRKQIYIPKGFGHAFLSLEDNTNVVMRIDNCFHPNFRKAICYCDPALNITFPIKNPILSQMDIEAPLLMYSDCNF
ncbi:MAG: dTDP-4-dehydrorhamnose 3,5-epimerase [Oscillospiraceae bacterium]